MWWILPALTLLAGFSTRALANDCCPECVIVAVDLDPGVPGFQTTLDIAPGTRWVRDVTIWIHDPAGSATLHSIGFVGGLNRGIAFGHTPDGLQHQGQVVGITATSLAPVILGNTAFVNNGIEEFFGGPELQYFEFGELGSAPGTISASPASPAVTLDIELSGTTEGDVFRFYLGDKTAEWLAGSASVGGAFSTQDLNTLESGGDACPDGTLALAGTDPDPPAPAPPAPFPVDYVDSAGGSGGATIRVVAAAPGLSAWGLGALILLTAGCAAALHSTTRRPRRVREQSFGNSRPGRLAQSWVYLSSVIWHGHFRTSTMWPCGRPPLAPIPSARRPISSRGRSDPPFGRRAPG